MTMSGLAYIDISDPNPLKLFRQWRDEYSNAANVTHYYMCVATVSKDGNVSNRNVNLQELDENGFVFATDSRSRKSLEIEENSWVAASFLWIYGENGRKIIKQVRVEGRANQISKEKCQEYYDEQPLFGKIRDAICIQDKEVDWAELKAQHDAILDDALQHKIELPMPSHVVGYCIVPEKMDFYYSFDNYIADRVVFEPIDNGWKYAHVAS